MSTAEYSTPKTGSQELSQWQDYEVSLAPGRREEAQEALGFVELLSGSLVWASDRFTEVVSGGERRPLSGDAPAEASSTTQAGPTSEAGSTSKTNTTPQSISELLESEELLQSLILSRLYDIPIEVDRDFLLSGERDHRVVSDVSRCVVSYEGELPDLAQLGHAELLALATEGGALFAHLDRRAVRVTGYATYRAYDVTRLNARRQVAELLITPKVLLKRQGIRRLEALLGRYLGKEAVSLFLLVRHMGELLRYTGQRDPEERVGETDILRLRRGSLDGTCIMRSIEHGTPELLSQVGEAESEQLAPAVAGVAVESAVVVPLATAAPGTEATSGPGGGGGALLITSPESGGLNLTDLQRMEELVDPLAVAVEHSLEEYEARISQVVEKQCTAVHSSVRWRFRKAAARFIEHARRTGKAEMERITFDDVHPLYSATDIRDSSVIRSQAMQEDFTEELLQARAIIQEAKKRMSVPGLDELLFRIDQHLRDLDQGLEAGAEVSLIDFLKEEVQPAIEFIADEGGAPAELFEQYQAAFEEGYDTASRNRSAFDRSVATLNREISRFIDIAQEQIQPMYPHYFEKHATDGVDQTVYVGASIAGKVRYLPFHLRNIRLWQLIVMARLGQLTAALKELLPVPLETTQLIVAQHLPISISFSYDEKRFRVDGSYNIRYEIMKKRIDKATVRGTGERLTQPGKIAVVYTQEQEEQEYRELFSYLADRRLLEPEIEHLELDELQGASGLRALRSAFTIEPQQPVDSGDTETDTFAFRRELLALLEKLA